MVEALILEIIGRFPRGATLEEILLGLGPTVARRTLQRKVAALVKNNQLIVVGRARARRYLLPSFFVKRELPSLKNMPVIPLSKEGDEIQKKMAQPLQARLPVTYNKRFLEEYQPNKTHYLSADLREKLGKMGNVREGNYPAGTYARQLFHRLLIDLSWNSSRLEGNTYSLIETERLLDWQQVAAGKDLKETQMILNHKAAIEFLINSAKEIGVDRFTILNLHTLLSDNLMSDPAASGRLRVFSVAITHSTYLPSAIPQVIEECFDLLLSKAAAIKDPFEQAFFLLVHIPYLQAFDDVNKRTSRLAANIPLIQKNLCPLSFVDVPETVYVSGLLGVYELNRMELLRDVFVWSYERSCQLYCTVQKSLGEPDPFRLQYRVAIKQVVGDIVRGGLTKPEAIRKIRQEASRLIAQQDQTRFIEVVESELLGLHEGNVARYLVSLREYENWKQAHGFS